MISDPFIFLSPMFLSSVFVYFVYFVVSRVVCSFDFPRAGICG
jgi:hypothetical protein